MWPITALVTLTEWKEYTGLGWRDVAEKCRAIGVDVSDEHLRLIADGKRPARGVSVDVVLAIACVSCGAVRPDWFVSSVSKLTAKLEATRMVTRSGRLRIPADR